MKRVSIIALLALTLILGGCERDDATLDNDPDTTQDGGLDGNDDGDDNTGNNDDDEPEGGLVTLDLFASSPTITHDGIEVVTFEEIKIIENRDNEVSVADYGSVGDGVSDDTAAIQAAIDAVSEDEAGGIVYLPKANYAVTEIYLKSNVHLHIESGAVLSYHATNSGTNQIMFNLGEDWFVENVVVCGVNGRFTIDITDKADKPRVFLLTSVHHFLISDVDIYDNKVQFPIITFTPDNDFDPELFGPSYGVIRNASSFNNHYGYGLVQVQTAKKVYFENLYGKGGVVLRFETGSLESQARQFGGVWDCRGYNITGLNGNATVMIAPHALHNGVVQVDDVNSYSCGWGVRIDDGYVENDLSDYEGDFTSGTFDSDNSYVNDVYAEFGYSAQVKTKHYKYLSDELMEYVPTADGNNISEPAPAIAAVIYEVTSYSLWLDESSVEAVGFLYQDDIVYVNQD